MSVELGFVLVLVCSLVFAGNEVMAQNQTTCNKPANLSALYICVHTGKINDQNVIKADLSSLLHQLYVTKIQPSLHNFLPNMTTLPNGTMVNSK